MSVAARAATVRPHNADLRLLPAPASEPPYDDEPGPRRPLRLVTAYHAPAGLSARLTEDDPPSDTPEQPDATVFAQALVQRLLEVCAGVRSLLQLRADTTPELYDQLERALELRPRTTGLRPSRRDVRSVHVQQQPDGVAEVCATIRRGAHFRALALRLETQQGRWTCTRVVGL